MILTKTLDGTLKKRLDRSRNFEEAEAIVAEAITKFSRDVLLDFLKELYQEFVGPDFLGGGAQGTMQHIKNLVEVVQPSDEEITSWRIVPAGEVIPLTPNDFWSVVRHA